MIGRKVQIVIRGTTVACGRIVKISGDDITVEAGTKRKIYSKAHAWLA